MNVKHLSLCASSCLPLMAGYAQVQESKPNIILILVDDLGWSDFGCYGSEIRTPAIDSLAQNGLRYRQFYNTARSSPSRCSILTGLYAQQAAVSPGASLPNLRTDNNITIAELLKDNGYRTYMAGKWHLGTTDVKRDPVSRGFQHVFGMGPNADGDNANFWDISLYGLKSENNEITWDDYAGRRFHQTDAIGDYTVRFIQHDLSKGDGKPFFIYMAFNAPHFPISGPAEIADKYTDVADPNPGDEDYYRYEDGWDKTRAYRFARQKELGVIDDNYELSPRSDAIIPANTPIPAWNTLDLTRRNDLARRMAVYAASITQIDNNVKKVVDELKATNQLDNTLILILSDNGGNYEGNLYGNPNPRQLSDLYTMGQANDPASFPRMNLGGGWANVANTPFRLYKHFAHEGGIRTPGIIFYPGHISNPGSWVDQPAHIIDIMATIVDVTGSTYPEKYNSHVVLPMEGQSLKPEFTGNTIPERSLFVEHESNRAFFDGDYKLVTKNFALSDGSSPANQLELYNIKKDPSELHNLASELPDKLNDMVAKWNETAKRIGVPTARLITDPKEPKEPEHPELEPQDVWFDVDFSSNEWLDAFKSATQVDPGTISPGTMWDNGAANIPVPVTVSGNDFVFNSPVWRESAPFTSICGKMFEYGIRFRANNSMSYIEFPKTDNAGRLMLYVAHGNNAGAPNNKNINIEVGGRENISDDEESVAFGDWKTTPEYTWDVPWSA
ncbi:MAG: sulfatase-like hydrolase/transferase, partial [Candidatus Azobacteroides sp.]|nr:sulfatase-like hydrolase/transferase [Candidatus Azobacteroides sp.]